MKQVRFVAVALLTGFGLSSFAIAQGDPRGQAGPGPGGQQYQQYQQDQARPGSMVGHNGGGIQNPNYARQPNMQGQPQRGYADGRPPMQAYGGPRANGPRDWHRGDRLPNDYRNRQYVVEDYRGYGLSRPQRGYQWIGVNGDYALVAISSGVIAQIVVSGR